LRAKKFFGKFFLSSDNSHRDRLAVRVSLHDTAIVLLLAAIAFASRFFLLQSNHPSGSDGYIYLVQIRSIIEEHRMHYPDISLIYPWFTAIALFTKNYLLAYKIGIAAMTSLMTVGVFLFLKRSRKHAFLVSLWISLSPSVLFFASQFPKNFLAVAFFILMLVSFRARNIPVFLLFFAAAFVTHRMTASLTLIFLLSYILVSRKKIWIILLIITAGAAVLALLSFFPGTLHVSDLARLQGFITPSPQFAPFSFISLAGSENLHPILVAEIILSFAVAVSCVIRAGGSLAHKNPLPKMNTALLLCILLPYIPFLTFDAQGVAYRFFLAGVPLSFLLIPYAFRIRRAVPLIILANIMIFSGVLYLVTEKTDRYDPPYALYENLSRRIHDSIGKEKPELIIAHRPFAETIDYTLRADTLAWKPETRFDRRNVWRVAKGIELWEVERALAGYDRRLAKVLSAQYILVREDLWEKFVAASVKSEIEDLRGRILSDENPFKMRPEFVTRVYH
jgi:hypothetical protein